VLETAVGTGVVTRELARILPLGVAITATDLNEPMIALAQANIGGERIRWQQADALDLPFPNGAFDVVVCQFGVMFFPDKPKAFGNLIVCFDPAATSCSTFGTVFSRRTPTGP
jgi:ubiquinone/menaquinone biosynthesis C-methylase UbiE